jgi:hypothetical protein
MPDPIPSPEAAPQPKITIGETPIYLATPQKIGEATVTSVMIQSADKRANAGEGSAVILTREASRKKGEEGLLIDKPMNNVNNFDEVDWNSISGVRLTDEAGNHIDVPKESLTLTKPETITAETPEGTTPPAEMSAEIPVEAPLEAPVVEEKPPLPPIAREVLSNLQQEGNVITIVGLKAYETRALDLADRSMQHIVPRQQEQAAAAKNLWEKTKESVHGLGDLGTMIWKQSIGGIYFHEKARQYYLKMLQASETPFAEQSIRVAEARALEKFNQKLADQNFLQRAGTKVVEWFKSNLGKETAIQKLALEEIASMKTAGEIRGQDTFESEAKAVRARFGQDMSKAEQFVRTRLGEKLEILDSTKEEHKPLVEGIQNLMKRYASPDGDIKDKAEFDAAAKDFFKTALKDARPDIFAEAELYSSSLFEAADTLKMKISHEGGLANLDEAMAGMEIRLALGQMGEVTSANPTAVTQGVERVRQAAEWLQKQNVLVPMVFNEATVASGVAISLSAGNFLKTVPARALGGLGAGALAGGLFAGWREYGQLNKDYLTHLRERESGSTFPESMKRRAWFEKYTVKQRSAEEMIHTMRDTMYEADGTTMKASLTDDEIRSTMATVVDTQARKEVSESGEKHVGLIQFRGRESIETERSALDLMANKALGDLESYLAGHQEQAEAVLGGNTFPDFMVKLTQNQTQVLRSGVNVLNGLEDPVKGVLGIVAEYAPEASIAKRRFPLASNMATADEKALGVDAILEEFKKEARVEAIKYGIKQGVIGAGIGVALHGVTELFAHTPNIVAGATEKLKEAVHNTQPHTAELSDAAHATATAHVAISPPDADHTAMIGTTKFELPKEVSIVSHTTGAEGRTTLYEATIHAGNNQPDISLGANLTESQLKDKLHDIGLLTMSDHKAGEIVQNVSMHDSIIPNIKAPDGSDLHFTLPNGYNLHYVPDHGNWQIVDSHTNTAITSLKFNEAGQIVADKTQLDTLQHQLMDKGLKMHLEYQSVGPEHVVMPHVASAPAGVEAPVAPASVDMTTIKGNELNEGGLWNYFLKHANDAHSENPMSATNASKNLFRVYEQYYAPHNADHVPTNIYPSGSEHVAHLRDATFGGTPVKEFDIAKIGNDAAISVPKNLFGPDGLANITKLNDIAIHDYQALVQTGLSPTEALAKLAHGTDHQQAEALLLKLGYFGRDSDLPTSQDALAPLLRELHVTGLGEHAASGAGIGVAPVEAPVPPVELHHLTLNATYTSDANARVFAQVTGGIGNGPVRGIDIPYHLNEAAKTPVEQWLGGMDESARAALHESVTKAAGIEYPWFPIMIPLREALEAAPVEVVDTRRAPGEVFFAPFGGDEAYLSKEALADRTSPSLKEDPKAALSQPNELTRYMTTLTEEEQQKLAAFKEQAPEQLAPETRTIVMIPTSGNGTSVYNMMTRYSAQTDKAGNPVNPKQTELLVFDHLTGEQTADTTKAEVDRFKAEHPDMQVAYVTHTYAEAPARGQIKRDMSNFALQQVMELPQDHPDVIIVTNPGMGVPDTYLSAVMETFDTMPIRDLVTSNYALPQEAYQQYPQLFAGIKANQIFDALVRHGEMNGMPGVYDGSTATRASTLAAVGGYNQTAPMTEDREVAWMVSRARANNPESVGIVSDATVALDPKEMSYAALQQLGLADSTVSLADNPVYKDLTWQELAAKASEAYTKENLEQSLNGIYQTYPGLKAAKPQEFDAYFKRTMDTLGVSYEITDGKVTITDESLLAANVGADIDVEAMAADAVKEIHAAPAESPRETLADIAQVPEEVPAESAPEAPSETTPNISSPEVTAEPAPQVVTETPAEASKPETPVEPPAQDQPLG